MPGSSWMPMLCMNIHWISSIPAIMIQPELGGKIVGLDFLEQTEICDSVEVCFFSD